jgi:hypothetical protein
MKRLVSLSPPQLLLAGLLALLLFGSCGGGVNGFLRGLGPARRERLREVLAQEKQARRQARQQLRGRTRFDMYDRILTRTQTRLDSLVPGDFGQRKLQHRPHKVARRLRAWPELAPSP